MDIQRLRNLTTGLLHTNMGHIYEDLEYLTGARGVMTHMIPRLMMSIRPWLKKRVTDDRLWDETYDTTHVGDYPIEPMSKSESDAMFARYKELPNPLDGKDVTVVVVPD